MSNGTLIADAGSTGERLRLAGRPRLGEALVRGALVACGWFVLGTTIAMLGFLARTGLRGLHEVGVTSLFASDTWKPEAGSFGALALIVGTFTSALGAIAIGAAPAVLAAVWLTEFASESVRRAYRRVLEESRRRCRAWSTAGWPSCTSSRSSRGWPTRFVGKTRP